MVMAAAHTAFACIPANTILTIPLRQLSTTSPAAAWGWRRAIPANTNLRPASLKSAPFRLAAPVHPCGSHVAANGVKVLLFGEKKRLCSHIAGRRRAVPPACRYGFPKALSGFFSGQSRLCREEDENRLPTVENDDAAGVNLSQWGIDFDPRGGIDKRSKKDLFLSYRDKLCKGTLCYNKENLCN